MVTIFLLSEFTEVWAVLLVKVIDTSCVCLLYFHSKVFCFFPLVLVLSLLRLAVSKRFLCILEFINN